METKQFEITKGLQNILKNADMQGIRVHSAGFKTNDVIIVPTAENLESRTRQIAGSEAKFIEIKATVNKVEKFISIGSLYRGYKTDENSEFLRPNGGLNNLADCLGKIVGKTITLTKIENAIAPNFNTQVYEPVSVFNFKVK